MAMDDIGNPIHIVQRRQGCFGEIAVFRNIIDEIGIWISSAEELLIVNEIIHHAVPDIFHNAHIEGPAVCTEIHFKGTPVYHFFLIFPRDAFVTRENDLYIAVLLYQFFG